MNDNFRCHLLSLSLLIGVMAPWAAIAQAPISSVGSDSVQNRVTQLERVSNAHGNLLTQLQQQLLDSQRDIDGLRGQIQESQHQLKQLIERQRQTYQQMEGLNKRGAQRSPTPAAASIAPDAVTGQGAVPALTGGVIVGTGDGNSDYSTAVSLSLDKKQYDQAISSFQNFVRKYPQSIYQPNANYWLGQLYYNTGKKDAAAYYYAVVVKNYPKSPKSPDAMLKVGMIMQEKGQIDKARAVYQQVGKLYAGTEAATQAKKRLSGL